MSTLFRKILGQLDGFSKSRQVKGNKRRKFSKFSGHASMQTDILPRYSVSAPENEPFYISLASLSLRFFLKMNKLK